MVTDGPARGRESNAPPRGRPFVPELTHTGEGRRERRRSTCSERAPGTAGQRPSETAHTASYGLHRTRPATHIVTAAVWGLGWGGPPGAALDAASAGQFEIVTSPALLDGPRRVLGYPKL
jgi:hypothetical protein